MERLTDQIEALVRSSMKAGTIGGAVILVERSGETVVASAKMKCPVVEP